MNHRESTDATNEMYPQYLLTKVPEIPTLRDFFAGCALIAISQGAGLEMPIDSLPDFFAGLAYQLADAMLKEREK